MILYVYRDMKVLLSLNPTEGWGWKTVAGAKSVDQEPHLYMEDNIRVSFKILAKGTAK